MAKLKLEAQVREELGKYVQVLREQLFIPAVVYGGKTNHNIKIKKSPLEKAYENAGESTIIDLVIDGKNTIPVIIKDIQRHPTTHEISHVDFYELDMTKEIVAMVPLAFVGEAPAVKLLGGALSINIDEVEIKCLPINLIHEVKVDLSVLDKLDKSIHIKDLTLPENVLFATNKEVMVVKVAEQKAVVEEVVVEPSVADVKVDGEEKKVATEPKG